MQSSFSNICRKIERYITRIIRYNCASKEIGRIANKSSLRELKNALSAEALDRLVSHATSSFF